MAINPTRALIDALRALKDLNPQEVDIEQIIGHANIHSIFWPVSRAFRCFVEAAEVDFRGIQHRNLSAIDSIIWLLQHGVSELPENSTFHLEMMSIAGGRFEAQYWVSVNRQRIRELEAELARLTEESDPNRRYLQVCRENDGLKRRIAELEAELVSRPPAPNIDPS